MRNVFYDRYFDFYDYKYNGLNLVVEVFLLIVLNLGSFWDVYRGGFGYFWGKIVYINDYVIVKFD